MLIVGVGAVGSLLADELAHLGYSPLVMIDYDVLEPPNLNRHRLGAKALGEPKAEAMAEQIRGDLPGICDARGVSADFTKLTVHEQLEFVQAADIVVAATDDPSCQLQINLVCLQAEKPAVYPGVWVQGDVEAAEVGEIQWVLPGRHTPCYQCATIWRQQRGGGNAEPRHGTRAALQVLVNATIEVVGALLEPASSPGLLDPHRTLILTHGVRPASHGVRDYFRGRGARSAHIELPATPCPACGAARSQARQRSSVPPPPRIARVASRTPLDPPLSLSQYLSTAIVLVTLFTIMAGVVIWLSGSPPPGSDLGSVEDTTTFSHSVELGAGVVEVAAGSIQVGQSVSVFASGTLGYGYEGDAQCAGYPTTTPDGNRMVDGKPCAEKIDKSMPVPLAPVGSLIVAFSEQGPWHFIGSSASLTAPNTGTLYFAYNDSNRTDDTGSYTVKYAVTG